MDLEICRKSMIFLRQASGVWAVGCGEFEWHTSPPKNHAAFYAPDFFLTNPKPWCVPQEFLEVRDEDFARLWQSQAAPFTRTWEEPKRDTFEKVFSKVQNSIQEDLWLKCVPVVFAQAQGTPTEPERMRLLTRLIASHKKFLAYGGWWEQEGLVGLSPEILFTLGEGWIETMALAGTSPLGDPKLSSDAKELKEHNLVVEDILHQLKDLGLIKKTPTRVWPAGSIQHLRTDILVENMAEKISFGELVSRLHPTAALGIYPRLKNWRQVEALTGGVSRQRFGAPFGFQRADNTGFCVVAIRQLQWQDDDIFLGSGCGLVAESDFEKEWQELTHKRQSVKELLGLL